MNSFFIHISVALDFSIRRYFIYNIKRYLVLGEASFLWYNKAVCKGGIICQIKKKLKTNFK